jgi:DNA-binding MarR family transcriptional regulator
MLRSVNAGELFRIARLLREVALVATRDPGEPPAPPGLVAIVDDIARHDGTSVGEIAARTGLAQSLVSKTVARLRDAGIVDVAQDTSDRRRTRIAITDSARSEVFAARGERPITRALSERLPHLPAKRAARAEALLDQLASTLLTRPTNK